MEMNGASPFGDGTKPWRPEGAREFKIGHCPSTHVLGYDCVALRAGAPKLAHFSVKEVVIHPNRVEQKPDRQRKQQGIDAIKHATMPGKQRAGVLYFRATLQRRLNEVSELRGDIHAHSEQSNEPEGCDREP